MQVRIENGNDYCKNIISERILKINNINKKEIIIWGLTSWAKFCIHELRRHNVKISSIIDNNSLLVKSRNHYLGIPIESPKDKLIEEGWNNNGKLLIIASSHYQSMKKDAISLNSEINEKSIVSLYPNDESKMFKQRDLEGKKLLLKECQIELLNTFKNFLVLLDKYHIKYYLAYGTLLGCIREGGIIPWDDDIDVEIPWEDYLKLCNLSRKPNSGLECFQSPLSEYSWKNTITTLGKVLTNTVSDYFNFPLRTNQGLAIDVWPLVNFPNSELQQIEYGKLLTEAGDLWKENVVMRIESDNYDERVHKKTVEYITNVMSKYAVQNCDYCGVGYCGQLDIPNMNRAFHKDLYKETYKQFESINCCVPSGFDEILKRNYGDYMNPPKQDFIPRFQNVHSVEA